MNQEENKTVKLSVRRTLKLICFICMIIFFIPTFVVSCSSQEMKISASNVAEGIKSPSFGTIANAQPIVYILLLIPIAMLVMLYVKKYKDNQKLISKVFLALSVIDIVIWFVLRHGINSKAEEEGCIAKTTLTFKINIILWIIVAILSWMLYKKKLLLSTELLSEEIVEKVKDSVKETAAIDENARKCPKCGAVVKADNQFCTSCGAKIEQEETAEEIKQEEPSQETVE